LGQSFFRDAPAAAGRLSHAGRGGKGALCRQGQNLRNACNTTGWPIPNRMPRRHLRMIREVARIEFQFCHCESAALKRESETAALIETAVQSAAGVWPGKTTISCSGVRWRNDWNCRADVPEAGWQRYGPLGAGGAASSAPDASLCLLWLAVRPKPCIHRTFPQVGHMANLLIRRSSIAAIQ